MKQLPSLSPQPYYRTSRGAAYLGDALGYLKQLDAGSVNLIMTSPPFALQRQKEYGNVGQSEYVQWFLAFAKEFHRVLADDGSLVIDIGGSWVKGLPIRSLYHFELLIALCTQADFYLAEEFYWWNKAKLPSPAEWVNVRRIRVKDAVDPVWWLSKSEFPKADNRKVLTPYSESMNELLKSGYQGGLRPSGHDITDKFSRDNGGAIPPNLLAISHTESNSRYLQRCRELKVKPHPARFPSALPEFFLKFLTDEDDLVLDPFAGSNVTGQVAEGMSRRWLGFELVDDYLKGSLYRFEDVAGLVVPERPANAVEVKAAKNGAKSPTAALAPKG
jgi:DNA modification methylase